MNDRRSTRLRRCSPVDDLTEAFVGGMIVPSDGVATDRAALLFVAGVVGDLRAHCKTPENRYPGPCVTGYAHPPPTNTDVGTA